MKILAFLQNQWFKDPDRIVVLMKKYVEHEKCPHKGRERFIRDMLFFGCLTGKRLEAAFGEELCDYDGIVWEESSRHIGGRASSSAPADPVHMAEVITRHKPDVVLLFGKIAQNGIVGIGGCLDGVRIICGPHPAARGETTVRQLNAMAEELRVILSFQEDVACRDD